MRDNLKRLSRENYQGDAIVHWTNTVRDRKQGWLNAIFLYRFREILTHTLFRYGLVCPMFCLMPDHFHMVWMGLFEDSDQLNAMKYFRTRCNESIERIGFELQDQAHDNVFKDDQRKCVEFRNACEYIARNPERAELVGVDQFASYTFSGCLIPGYPELRPFAIDYWDRFDRTVSALKRAGIVKVQSPPP